MSPLTTHALDTSCGKPAVGLELSLYKIQSDDTSTLMATRTCDGDGRVKNLVDEQNEWQPGVYRIRFQSEKYFQSQGKDCFYPYCDVTFTILSPTNHYHVPLLLSPFGYTTYRGS